MERYAVIVDPYGGAADFGDAFRARGITPMAVLSTPEPLASYAARWFPEHFARTHFFDGDLDELVQELRCYDPICVVPGNEQAVELTADLVDALVPGTGNLPGSAPAQRDKWQMALALERAHVPRLKQICTGDPGEVARWIAGNDLAGRPLVLKPPKSGGTDNVVKVGAGEDWRGPFDQQRGYVNRFGIPTEAVLVQEYVEGTEFIVDLYSVDGRHGLVDVCRYRKHDRGERIAIYDYAEFVPPDHPDVAVLAPYTMRAADAVGIRNGSTHAEVMLTDDGPLLIELASRLSGSCMMISGRLATGDCQIDRTVRHYVDGSFTPGFELLQNARTVWLCAERDGIVRNIELLEELKRLPTVDSMSLPGNGQTISATYDMFTAMGWINLASPDMEAIEEDYLTIRETERRIVIEAPDAVSA